MIHLLEVPGRAKFTEPEQWLPGAGVWALLNRCRVSVLQREKVLEMDNNDGYTTK